MPSTTSTSSFPWGLRSTRASPAALAQAATVGQRESRTQFLSDAFMA
jgi:hypothetical protein